MKLQDPNTTGGDGSSGPFRIKIATQAWEFEEIHRLNHLTFVEEIPQHPTVESGCLVDRFHNENTYIIAIWHRRVVAMTAIRGTRPFSLDSKINNLDAYLPQDRRTCEIRLLAIRRQHRSGRLLQRLLGAVWHYCIECGYDAAVISGTTTQLNLYRHLGFVPFGPLVGSSNVFFQPMMITLEGAAPVAGRLFVARSQLYASKRKISFLPGPVPVRRAVRQAFNEEAVSHRSPEFAADLAIVRAGLCRLTGARYAEILLGSGTLANDAIAGQLSLLCESGLILSNGEFGDRLVDHAERFRLGFEVMRWPWGHAFDIEAVRGRLQREPRLGWLWFVQHETSTGVLNDLAAMRALCSGCPTKMCVDSISAVGALPVDLRDVYFASTVSGKALGAFPGLAIVLHNQRVEASSRRLPRYLDLSCYAQEAVPYTHSSNLVRALKTTLLDQIDWNKRFRLVAERSRWLRHTLRRLGFEVVAPETHAAPGVVTIALPATLSAQHLRFALDDEGYAIATTSEYLRRRNWVQISTMAAPSYRRLRALVDALAAYRDSLHHNADVASGSNRSP